MNKIILLLALVFSAGMASAMTASFTANRTYADSGQNLTLNLSVGGGVPPYYFTIYQGNYVEVTWMEANSSQTVNVGGKIDPILKTFSYANYRMKVFSGISYWLAATDSAENTTNSILQVTVNATPKVALSPGGIYVTPWTNQTFTNTVVGGTPPYSYSYNITGGSYVRYNNTIMFNGIGLYYVGISVTDALNVMANSLLSKISTFLPPTSTSFGSCQALYNLSEGENATVQLNGQTLNVVAESVVPTGIEVVVSGSYIQVDAAPVQVAGYYIKLLNVTWMPILRTASIEFCPGWLTTTSTSTVSTTATSSTTLSTISSSSSTSTSTTSTTTTIKYSLLSPGLVQFISDVGIVLVIAGIIGTAIVIYFYNWRFKNKDDGLYE